WQPDSPVPRMEMASPNEAAVKPADPELLSNYTIHFEGDGELLFCDNESNNEALFGSPNPSPFPKDAIGQYIVEGRKDAVNPEKFGTNMAASYYFDLAPGESKLVTLRFVRANPSDRVTNLP